MATGPQVILSVDDNDVDGALLERAFKRTGATPRLFRVSEGPQALAYLSGQGIYADRENYPLPDLILLDLKMPKMSGWEVLSWIRNQPPLKKISVVVLTASDRSDDITQAQKAGADGYFIKPTKFEDLKSLVVEICSKWLDSGKKGKAAATKAANPIEKSKNRLAAAAAAASVPEALPSVPPPDTKEQAKPVEAVP